MQYTTTWKNFEDILSKISQSQDIYCMVPVLWQYLVKLIEAESRTMVIRVWGKRKWELLIRE